MCCLSVFCYFQPGLLLPTHNFFPKIVLLMKNDKHRKYRIIVVGKTNSTFLGPWFGGFYQKQQTGLKIMCRRVPKVPYGSYAPAYSFSNINTSFKHVNMYTSSSSWMLNRINDCRIGKIRCIPVEIWKLYFIRKMNMQGHSYRKAL
jgi:hypothetical protein